MLHSQPVKRAQARTEVPKRREERNTRICMKTGCRKIVRLRESISPDEWESESKRERERERRGQETGGSSLRTDVPGNTPSPSPVLRLDPSELWATDLLTRRKETHKSYHHCSLFLVEKSWSLHSHTLSFILSLLERKVWTAHIEGKRDISEREEEEAAKTDAPAST